MAEKHTEAWKRAMGIVDDWTRAHRIDIDAEPYEALVQAIADEIGRKAPGPRAVPTSPYHPRRVAWPVPWERLDNTWVWFGR